MYTSECSQVTMGNVEVHQPDSHVLYSATSPLIERFNGLLYVPALRTFSFDVSVTMVTFYAS